MNFRAYRVAQSTRGPKRYSHRMFREFSAAILSPFIVFPFIIANFFSFLLTFSEPLASLYPTCLFFLALIASFFSLAFKFKSFHSWASPLPKRPAFLTHWVIFIQIFTFFAFLCYWRNPWPRWCCSLLTWDLFAGLSCFYLCLEILWTSFNAFITGAFS